MDNAEMRADSEFAALLEAVDDGVFVMDDAGCLVCMSRSFELCLGPAALGSALGDWVAPISRAEFTQQLSELMRVRAGSVRLRLRLRDAQHGWFDLRLTRGRFRGEGATFGIAREIPSAPSSQPAPRRGVLADNAIKFGDVFQSSLFCMSICDLTGNFVEVNPAFERATGVTAAEALGKTAFDLSLVPLLDGDRVQRRLAAEGTSHASRVTIRRRDGSTREHVFCASLLQSGVEPAGQALVFSVSYDVTEYESAQLSHRAQDQMFRALCKSLPDGVFFIGPSGTFLEANEAACRQHGYEPGELVGLPIQQIAARSDFDFQQVIGRLRERGQLQYEAANRRKDGSVFPIQLSLALIEDRGEGDFMVAGVARDLTETKLFESELRETRDRFSTLFATAPDALFIFEVDGTILDCNPAAEELFGRPRGELLGRSVDTLGIEGERAGDQAAPSHVGEGWRMTGPELYRITRADGSCLDVEARSVPLSIGGKTMMLATVQDVSRRLTAERARQRLEQQLHQANKMEAVGRLAGGIAHDFNNLLTVVAGYAELLLRDQAQGSSMAQGLSEILLASSRAAGLTTQLLAFSRKQIIEPHVLDLNVLLESATRMLERLIGEDVGLFFGPARDLYRVKVDPNQIEQLLINLAVNARDAMPTGGVLKIQTQNVTLREADLLDQPDAQPGDYVRLSVEDNGAGMSQETMGRLFEPFFTTKERGRGTGLGLSIIYGVVKQNGGFITVRSQLGLGSRFEIHLPRVTEAARVVTLHKEELSPLPRAHGRVLLVEDEEAVRDVTAHFLRNAGYQVTTASRASEVEALTESEHELEIDVLVTDVVLPEINGRELYERLLQKKPDLRAVFISGYTDEVIAQHGVVEPDILFLEKPFTQSALARKVQEAFLREPRRRG
jgi:PAS domain S-box-containing protein